MIKKSVPLNVSTFNNALVNVNVGENSRELEVSFVDGTSAFNLTGKTVSLYVLRGDNVTIHSSCTIVGSATDGKVSVLISSAMSLVQGLAHCEFIITDTSSSEVLKILGLKLMISNCNTSVS